MKFEIGNIAYFYKISDNEYSWNIHNYQKVIIENIGFDFNGDVFYVLGITSSQSVSWFSEDDLLTETEMRKNKIKNINEKVA